MTWWFDCEFSSNYILIHLNLFLSLLQWLFKQLLEFIQFVITKNYHCVVELCRLHLMEQNMFTHWVLLMYSALKLALLKYR